MRERTRCSRHPGYILKTLYIEPLALTITQLAHVLVHDENCGKQRVLKAQNVEKKNAFESRTCEKKLDSVAVFVYHVLRWQMGSLEVLWKDFGLTKCCSRQDKRRMLG